VCVCVNLTETKTLGQKTGPLFQQNERPCWATAVVTLATSQDFVCGSIPDEHLSAALLFVLELRLGRVKGGN